MLSRERPMKKLMTVALLAAAFAIPGALIAAETQRFAPVDPKAYSPAQQEFAKLMTVGPRAGTVTNAPFKVYFASPEFGLEAIKMSNYLRWGTGLDARLSELAIIIAAREWTSDYIWHAHYPLAVKGGLDPSVGADIAAGKRPSRMKEDEAIIYDLLTEIYRSEERRVGNFCKAKAKYGERGIMDIIGLAAYYGNTAMALIVSDGTRPSRNEP